MRAISREAVERLQAILGPPTIIMLSGSEWADPATGELVPQRHSHWRLSEPTREPDDHAKLARARKLAAQIVGADITGAPIAHPYRWAGSWNCKAAVPVLARSVYCRDEAEVDLDAALERLEGATEAAGLAATGAVPDAGRHGTPRPPPPLGELAEAVAAIPNDDLPYSEWVKIAYAICGATGGSAEGFAMWCAFSERSAKNVPAATEAVWLRTVAARPTRIGAGTLYFYATRSGWQRRTSASSSPPLSASPTSPTPSGPPPGHPAAPGTPDDWFDELNRRFAVVQVGGKTRIMSEVEDHSLTYPRRLLAFQHPDDFKLLLLNRKIFVADQDGKTRVLRIADLWLGHPDRRTHTGIGLYPPPLPAPAGHHNLWTGWGVEPAAGAWPLLRKHIMDVLGAGDDANGSYILKWIAWGFQNPSQKLEAAILLIGAQRSGKGTLGNLLVRLYGAHGAYVHRREQIIGRHNAHLAHCLLLFADEALIAHDEAAAGVLKSLITEPTLPIEPKFIDLYHVTNRLRIMFASNSEHALHLDPDDRRVAAFNVREIWGDDAQKHRDYFNELHNEIEHGGAKAFLYDMLALDISDFDPRALPQTPARVWQKLASLAGVAKWWASLLAAGEVLWPEDQPRPAEGVTVVTLPFEWASGPVPKAAVYRHFVDWARQQRDLRRVEGPAAFWKRLGQLTTITSSKPHGEPRQAEFPDLETARTEFAAFVKADNGALDWEDAEEAPREGGFR